MQTFLPHVNFARAASVLDYRRLGKQRVEAKQILKALHIPGYGWKNHPAVTMWRGYEDALCLYYNTIIDEWVRRGYRNNMVTIALDLKTVVLPPWLGDESFHASHRSNLLRKDPTFYSQYGWSEPDDLPYVWPLV